MQKKTKEQLLKSAQMLRYRANNQRNDEFYDRTRRLLLGRADAIERRARGIADPK